MVYFNIIICVRNRWQNASEQNSGSQEKNAKEDNRGFRVNIKTRDIDLKMPKIGDRIQEVFKKDIEKQELHP